MYLNTNPNYLEFMQFFPEIVRVTTSYIFVNYPSLKACNLTGTRLPPMLLSFYITSFFIVFSFIITALIIDTSIVKIYRFIFQDPSSQISIGVFYFTVIVYLVGQFILVKFIRFKIRDIQQIVQPKPKLILTLVTLLQYASAVTLITIIFQIVLSSSYSVLLLKVLLWLSYLQGILLTGFLAYKFFLWLRLHGSYIILLYGCAIITLSINCLFTLLHVNDSLMIYRSDIVPHESGFLPYLDQDNVLRSGFQISSFVSYLLMWLATVVLLRSHYMRFSKTRYWVTVSIPLVYFVIQFQPLLLELLSPFRLYQPILFGIIYTLFFSTSTLVGGILFGIAFWSTGKKVGNAQIRDFMVMSGYGVVLFFVSNQAIILNSAPYPPFGLATISFMGLGSYLLLVGIYSSAISVAQDITLRKSMKRSLERQTTFLEKIGTSEMEQEIQKRVLRLAKMQEQTMAEQTGIESSLDEDDMKEYLNQVIDEVKKHRQGGHDR